jgi:hypothetical protein
MAGRSSLGVTGASLKHRAFLCFRAKRVNQSQHVAEHVILDSAQAYNSGFQKKEKAYSSGVRCVYYYVAV